MDPELRYRPPAIGYAATASCARRHRCCVRGGREHSRGFAAMADRRFGGWKPPYWASGRCLACPRTYETQCRERIARSKRPVSGQRDSLCPVACMCLNTGMMLARRVSVSQAISIVSPFCRLYSLIPPEISLLSEIFTLLICVGNSQKIAATQRFPAVKPYSEILKSQNSL